MGIQFSTWPRLMKRQTACAYVDMSAAEFEREIASGRLPMPVDIGRGPRWSREEIDRCIEKLTGEADTATADDWRAQTKLYGNG